MAISRKFQGFERACTGLYSDMRTWLDQGRSIYIIDNATNWAPRWYIRMRTLNVMRTLNNS